VRATWLGSGSKPRFGRQSRKKRSFAISEPTRTLVFTDLDGTLLDHHFYSWEGAGPALAELRRRGVPLIFCTSKTRAEVVALRRTIGNTHPFIVENGGAIVIPAGYFRSVAPAAARAKNYTLMLGRPYEELIRGLREIAQRSGVDVCGFHQMTAEAVARATGLTLREARMAQQREAGEPFIFRNASAAGIRNFRRLAHKCGYSVQKGGRFWHFAGGHDKGLAMSALIGFYRVAWGTRIRTIALGDSGNDLLMLQLVDLPILMPKPNGSFAKEVTAKIPHVGRAKQPGSAGWGHALLQALGGSGKVTQKTKLRTGRTPDQTRPLQSRR
jgi:mannosyl-3-phosphoglycerate phosphatase